MSGKLAELGMYRPAFPDDCAMSGHAIGARAREIGMQRFKALLVPKGDAGQTAAWQELSEADLMEGDVTRARQLIPPSTTRTAWPSPARRR